jgi:CBS domain-containing membrane protein
MGETERDKSLDVDIERVGSGDKASQVARVAVVGTWGLTRDGGHATITIDCSSAAALEREVERLHGELDDALARGSAALGKSARSAAKQRAARGSSKARNPQPATSPEKPRLSLAWSVADLMTRDVRTVGANDPVAAAKALMDSGGFRHIVVVDEEGAIEGVLSHRDLFFGPLAWSIGQGRAAYEKLLNASRVKDVTHGNVATIDATAPLQEAATLMRERKIGCLPVVEGDRLVGVLTEGDFVELVAQASH